jgi:pimeloyl-[acyl-carrier protein] methyl ester esterase
VNELYAESSGRGPPLLLLHGWGMNLRVFDGLRAGLAARFAVTAVDLPGHGRSPWIAALSAAEQLAWITTRLPQHATLVGWSLGGQLALQMAADATLGVQHLVLMASTPRFVRAEDWPAGLPPAVLEQFALQLERDPHRSVADFLALQTRGSAAAAEVLATLQHAVSEHGAARPEALAAGLAQLQHNDLRELARGLAVPTLVIAGQYDRITPPAAAQALAALLPQGRLLAIRRAGHAPFVSHPHEVLAALLALKDDGAP